MGEEEEAGPTEGPRGRFTLHRVRVYGFFEPDKRLGDIGHAIQSYVEQRGFSIVREYCGHGIGRSFHEEPQVLHFGAPGTGRRLQPGMVFTIEPMVNQGGPEVRVLDDDWTALTVDGSLSAQFEHTVAVTRDGPDILSRFEDLPYSILPQRCRSLSGHCQRWLRPVVSKYWI